MKRTLWRLFGWTASPSAGVDGGKCREDGRSPMADYRVLSPAISCRLALPLTGLWLAGSWCAGATLHEDFTRDPMAAGWRVCGESNLFRWNITNENLEITWDSSRTNSYFYHALGTILTREDDFSLAFDLRVDELAIGVNPDKPFTFELAVGFLNVASATHPNWRRGAGRNPTYGPRNLVEFDYFPDSGYGATISPTVVSTNNQFATGFNYPLELDAGALFHVELHYHAGPRTLATRMTRNGASFGPVADVLLGASFSDFRCDAVAIISYSDAGADGSILGHGVVDNLMVTLPEPPVTALSGGFSNQVWRVQCSSRAHWMYTLERSADLRAWTEIPPARAGTGGTVSLTDASPAGGAGYFYRVRAERP